MEVHLVPGARDAITVEALPQLAAVPVALKTTPFPASTSPFLASTTQMTATSLFMT